MRARALFLFRCCSVWLHWSKIFSLTSPFRPMMSFRGSGVEGISSENSSTVTGNSIEQGTNSDPVGSFESFSSISRQTIEQVTSSSSSSSGSVGSFSRHIQPLTETPGDWFPGLDNPEHVCEGEKPKNDFHFRGAALGGWLVLEPWITPSMFYQFLGAYEKWGDEAPQRVAIDCMSFCTALGKEEANKQLRRHWRTWVTEREIRNLKQSGADTVRIPVADWMFIPYEPFNGCWDGAIDELDRVLGLCLKYNLQAILDIHTMRYSQNGMDSSGKAGNVEWTVEPNNNNVVSPINQISGSDTWAIPLDVISPKVTRYRHWQIQSANWIGNYNVSTKMYDQGINMTNINHGLDVVRAIVQRYKNNVVVVGIEPLNEPWWNTPLPWLKHYYWQSYQIVQNDAPHWITLLHDSFRFYLQNWGSFMVHCPNWALDVHLYQAWSPPMDGFSYQSYACEDGNRIREMEAAGVPVVVGEWSLATDSCALWIGGFQDNGPGNPKVVCDMVKCPDPYMGFEQPGAPPDPTKGPQDPFGTGGASYVSHGMCPIDRSFEHEDTIMQELAYSKLHSYDKSSHGQFFWNFRTELEPRWDFQESVRRNWIPRDVDSPITQIGITYSCPAGTKRPQPLPRAGPNLPGSALSLFVYDHQMSLAIFILLANVSLVLYAFIVRDFQCINWYERWGYLTISNNNNHGSTENTNMTADRKVSAKLSNTTTTAAATGKRTNPKSNVEMAVSYDQIYTSSSVVSLRSLASENSSIQSINSTNHTDFHDLTPDIDRKKLKHALATLNTRSSTSPVGNESVTLLSSSNRQYSTSTGEPQFFSLKPKMTNN